MNAELVARYGTDDPDAIDAILARQDARSTPVVPVVPLPELVAPRPAVYAVDPDVRARREYAELWPWQRWNRPAPPGWPTWRDRLNPTGVMWS